MSLERQWNGAFVDGSTKSTKSTIALQKHAAYSLISSLVLWGCSCGAGILALRGSCETWIVAFVLNRHCWDPSGVEYIPWPAATRPSHLHTLGIWRDCPTNGTFSWTYLVLIPIKDEDTLHFEKVMGIKVFWGRRSDQVLLQTDLRISRSVFL